MLLFVKKLPVILFRNECTMSREDTTSSRNYRPEKWSLGVCEKEVSYMLIPSHPLPEKVRRVAGPSKLNSATNTDESISSKTSDSGFLYELHSTLHAHVEFSDNLR